MKKLFLAVLSLSIALPMMAATSAPTPSYIINLFEACRIQAEAPLLNKMTTWVIANDAYKAQLAEVTALVAGKEAGEPMASGLYAKALLLTNLETQASTATLLKKRYEAAKKAEEESEKAGFVAFYFPKKSFPFWTAVAVGVGAYGIYKLAKFGKRRITWAHQLKDSGFTLGRFENLLVKCFKNPRAREREMRVFASSAPPRYQSVHIEDEDEGQSRSNLSSSSSPFSSTSRSR